MPSFLKRERLEQIRILNVGKVQRSSKLIEMILFALLIVVMTLIAHPSWFGFADIKNGDDDDENDTYSEDYFACRNRIRL